VRSAGGLVRRKHRGQAGLTLIEAIVALFILGSGVAALIFGLATVQRSAAVGSDQTQLEAAARQMGDFLRQNSAVPYVRCDSQSANYPDAYLPDTQQPTPNGLGSTFTTQWQPKVVEVAEATGSSLTQGGYTYNLVQEQSCTGSTASDYGVQRVTYSVTSQTTKRTLVRAVFKWDSSAS
jgi:Tfp pilus assembly protein PilV